MMPIWASLEISLLGAFSIVALCGLWLTTGVSSSLEQTAVGFSWNLRLKPTIEIQMSLATAPLIGRRETNLNSVDAAKFNTLIFSNFISQNEKSIKSLPVGVSLGRLLVHCLC